MTQLGTDFRVLAIHTPEGVRFDIPLAGPTVRFLAWFMDALVIYGAVAACAQCLHWIQVISPDLGRAIIVILVFVLNIGYPIALESLTPPESGSNSLKSCSGIYCDLWICFRCSISSEVPHSYSQNAASVSEIWLPIRWSFASESWCFPMCPIPGTRSNSTRC